MNANNPGKSAFTLIELLVVVTIIVALLALLVPAMDKAMEAAMRAKCGANLHALGLATHHYVQDFRGTLPPRNNDLQNFGDEAVYKATPHFLGSLIPYLGGSRAALRCPASVWVQGATHTPTDKSNTNYLGNATVYGRKLSRLPTTGMAIFMQEWTGLTRWAFNRPLQSSPGIYTYWHYADNGEQTYTAIHAGGGNLLYGDGRVDYRLNATLRAKDFGLTAGVTGNANDDNRQPYDLSYRSDYD